MANLLMTVLDVEDNIHCIDILSVDFIQTDNRKITYHIGETRYFHIMNKTELDEILVGHGFLSLDRPNLVNLKKIREFDENYGKVYFTEKTNKGSVYATVAKAKYKYVVKIINFFKYHNNDTTMEIKSQVKVSGIKSVLKGVFKVE